jgi:hypothetical protein
MPGQSPPECEPPDCGAVVEGVVVDGVVVVLVEGMSVVEDGVVVVAVDGVVVALLLVLAAYALVPPISAPAMPTIATAFLRCVFMTCLLRRCAVHVVKRGRVARA